MVRVQIRHFVTKGRRGGKKLYYWQPSSSLRQQGWRSQRLDDERGRALVQAEEINAQVDRWRAGGSLVLHPKEGSVSALIRLYCQDEAFTARAEKTRNEYRKHLRLIEDRFGDLPVAAITRRVIHTYKQQFADRPHQGNAILRTMRIVFGFAHDLGWIEQNPAAKPRQFTVRPRDQVWSPDDECRFIRAAHQLELPSMALALALGIYTAQREGDIIRMPWATYDGEWIRLRQRKTGKLIDIPVLTQLRAALEAVPRRGTIILTTETGRPYREDWFRHRFAQVMEAAGLTGLQFRDLRRTAVVRMGEQDIHERDIAAITGHEIERTRRILETYLPRNRVMAARAAKIMEGYYAGLTSEALLPET